MLVILRNRIKGWRFWELTIDFGDQLTNCITGSSTALSSSLASRVTTNKTKLDTIETNVDVTDTTNVAVSL